MSREQDLLYEYERIKIHKNLSCNIKRLSIRNSHNVNYNTKFFSYNQELERVYRLGVQQKKKYV